MTAGSEVTTKETRAPVETSPAATHFSRRTKWDLIVVTAGLIYILVILCLNLNTPFVSSVFISMAVRQLLWRDEVK